MIKDSQLWAEFERQWIAAQPADLLRNLRLVDSMYQLARKLGTFPGADPLEGIDKDIRLSRVFRHVRGPS